uniref:Uncharacterized protein n=1 Tax=Sinocyclocheilus rhinocerous TaxID=307959 RepID=A0A673J630_9TELE
MLITPVLLFSPSETLKVRSRKDSNKGKRNNQLISWVFQLNGVLDNVSQEDTYDRVARSVVLGAFGGYNGWSFKCIHM